MSATEKDSWSSMLLRVVKNLNNFVFAGDWMGKVNNTTGSQSRNAVNINITQMVVGKQRVKR